MLRNSNTQWYNSKVAEWEEEKSKKKKMVSFHFNFQTEKEIK